MIEKVRENFRKLLREKKCDELELSFIETRLNTTRYAKSTIHQNMQEENVKVILRAKNKNRIGCVALNSLEPAAMKTSLKKADDMARLAKPKKTCCEFAKPFHSLSENVDKCYIARPALKAMQLKRIFSRSSALFSGAYTTGNIAIGVLNSHGACLHHAFPFANANFIAQKGKNSGFASQICQMSRPDPAFWAEVALRKASHKKPPQDIKPGTYTVILEPQAVGDLFSWLGFIAFSGKAVHEGTSFMSKNQGRKLLHESVTIYDDGTDTTGIPLPFDFEGYARKKVKLIENGIVKEAAYDSTYAKLAKTKNTGHALPADEAQEGPLPLNIFMNAGDRTLDELIASTEHGLLITRFHYLNGLLNTPKAVFTGMTRDGTFLIRNGKIKYPVKNLRFTQSLVEAFTNIDGITRERKIVPLSDWSPLGTCVVPGVKLSSFYFTDVTE